MRARAGTASRRWELWAEGKVPQPKLGAGSSPLQQAPLLEREPQHRREPPSQIIIVVCWPLFLPGRQLFGIPSPPSHGLQDIQECVRLHAGVCEPATGWTVFVNPLETSQYSPELHLLHALKLTVQATRMTLTDLVQYNVF